MFDKISKDPELNEIYRKIETHEYNKSFWTYHGLRHVNKVIQTVEDTLRLLDYDEEFIENAKIAAFLHDLGMLEGKDGHDIRSYEIAKRYFEDNKIDLKYKEEILEAIRLHRNGFDSNNIMAVVLIFADKIDMSKSRLAHNGYGIVGLRQYQYIDDIIVTKDGNNLVVQFLVDDKCDKEELEGWYFVPKVFNAIHSFADHFGFDVNILWNDEEWTFVAD